MEGIKDEVELKCLSVLCGDAIVIRFLGTDGVHHNMLIDGGFSKTYQTVLKPAINKIILSGENIDLLILSHYDLDHIGGIIQLVNDKSVDLHRLVTHWWLSEALFNGRLVLFSLKVRTKLK
jgi:glyoxylase-like metal-dependent hydrolase (beta-lactamase superfamily II)